AQALGPLARHIVVPHAGHGTLALPCLRDAVARFITTDAASDALASRADCAASLPRPPAFVPPGAAP
ncbi:MAG: alpha/beta hydrolase, partial [Aquabacterium sp.]|nr:alpha/beta hydrolase [Aquabacterium sp.]